MDCLCAKFGDFSFSRFGLSYVRTDRITQGMIATHATVSAQ